MKWFDKSWWVDLSRGKLRMDSGTNHRHGLIGPAERVLSPSEHAEMVTSLSASTHDLYHTTLKRDRAHLSHAYLLLLTLGWLGAHRFYLKDVFAGSMQMSVSLITIMLFTALGFVRAHLGAKGNPEQVETATVLAALFIIAMIWLLVMWLAIDAFLLPRMVRERNRRLEVRTLTHLVNFDANLKRLNDSLSDN